MRRWLCTAAALGIVFAGFYIGEVTATSPQEPMAMLGESLEREQRMRVVIADRDRTIEARDELLHAVFKDGGTLRIVNFNPCLDCHAGCM